MRRRSGGTIWETVRTIIADVVLSFNVVAVAGFSGGDPWLLAFGLALTILLIIWASAIRARACRKLKRP